MIKLVPTALSTLKKFVQKTKRTSKAASPRLYSRVTSISAAAVAVLTAVVQALPAHANSYSLVCENPRREYVVSFSDGDAKIQLGVTEGITLYRVLAIEKTDARHVVVAVTMGDGPTVRLSLRPYMRMEYWSGNEIFQTDACRIP
jgi:hypothetical protein